MIYAERLCKHFDDFVAVKDVSFDVKAGQVLVLLGPNGAGKTTTVRMLTSILLPTMGWAKVAGFDVVKQPERVRASVGVLTEHHGLYGRMNAEEYLEFYGALYGLDRKAAYKRMDILLEQFGIADARKRRLGEYSKGMRQKLALVRALLHEPPVLLLDEPTSAMDPESARTVRDAIQSLRSHDRTIILCTHNLLEAEELADQVAIIRRGQIIIHDTPSNLKSRLLGPEIYEVRTTHSLEDWNPILPDGVTLVGRENRSLRFEIDKPEITNPMLLRQLMDNEVQVVSFQAMPRSLEQAYLQAVSQAE